MSEVTIGIPTYNCAMYLPYTLSKLQMQKINNLPVLVYDNGSTDGTIGLCSELFMRSYFYPRNREQNNLLFSFFVGSHDPKKLGYTNGQMTRKLIGKLVKTKYLFFLDPDVSIKPLSILRMLDEFKENDTDGKLAYMGMKYENPFDHPDPKGFKHIMMGATLWKTEVFNKLPECEDRHVKIADPMKPTSEENGFGCDCNFCFWKVKELGYRGMHSIYRSEHLKGVFV